MEWMLPPDMSMGVFLFLQAVSLIASFITVAFGIGGGTVLLAVMAVTVPTTVLIPVHGIAQLGSNAGRMALLIRHVYWPAVPAFTLGSIVGAVLGGMVVVALPASIMQIAIGLFIVWSVFSKPPAFLRRWGAVTGAISSFLTMFFGATGLFVASFTKSLELNRHAHVASHATFMTAQHLIKTLTFGFLGFAFGPWLPLALLMVVTGLIGTWLGRFVLTRISDDRFKWLLNAVLLILSARLIWAGVAELF